VTLALLGLSKYPPPWVDLNVNGSEWVELYMDQIKDKIRCYNCFPYRFLQFFIILKDMNPVSRPILESDGKKK
jgi:hypothetical protein